MPRPEKVQAVAEIKERLESARAVFLTEYAGLSVTEQQELRRGLRSSDAEYKVVKMSLARLAAADLGDVDVSPLLAGPTALAFANQDPVPVAKTLKEFADAHAALLIKGALLGGELLSPEKVRELAEIEPREVLLAKLAGAMQAPMANMAGLMVALLRDSAGLFKALLDKKTAAAPPEEAVAAAPPEEAVAVAEEAEPEAGAGDGQLDAAAGAEPEAAAEAGDEEPAAAAAAADEEEPAAEPAAEDAPAAEAPAAETAEEDAPAAAADEEEPAAEPAAADTPAAEATDDQTKAEEAPDPAADSAGKEE